VGRIALPIPLLSQVSIDPSVLASPRSSRCLTTLVCGLAPALGATGGSLVTALRDGAPSLSGSPRGRLVRQSFVIAEIALALTVFMRRRFARAELHRVAECEARLHR
jgi:hypothetical protein